MKDFIVIYKSRYHPLEGDKRKKVRSKSKTDIRNDWHDIIGTDEYKIVKIEEVK